MLVRLNDNEGVEESHKTGSQPLLFFLLVSTQLGIQQLPHQNYELMKKVLATFFVLLSFSFCNNLLAGKYSDGYIIRNGDTIRCQVRTPQRIQGLCQDCLQNSVLIKDSTGKETEYKSTELDGFGFVFYKEKYTFVPKVLTQGKPPIFMRVEILGKKLNLYSYVEFIDNLHFPKRYFLEDDRKRTTTDSHKKLKEFFADQPELLALYKDKRPNFWEFPDFVNIVNSKM